MIQVNLQVCSLKGNKGLSYHFRAYAVQENLIRPIMRFQTNVYWFVARVSFTISVHMAVKL